MKTFVIFIFAFLSTTVNSQNNYVWPIKGAEVGSNIISKPQDYINEELNFSNLFISASEGTEIITPCSGVIKSFYYTYNKTLIYSFSFGIRHNDTLTIAENDNLYRKQLAEKYKYIKDPKFISISISVETKKGEKYTVKGIRPIKYFKKETKINKGDLLGTVGYSYNSISSPSIEFSRSVNRKPVDPMSVFGISSSFVPSSNNNIDYNKQLHSVSDLLEDFNVFKNALEEAHPGLYDYIKKEELDSIFLQTKVKINQPMTTESFMFLLYPVIRSIKDNHTAVQAPNIKIKFDNSPEILFGLYNDSIIVFSTQPKYKGYLNKYVQSINGENFKSIISVVDNTMYGNDGYIESLNKSRFLTNLWKYYGKIWKKNIGEKIDVQFTDGSKQTFIYLKYIPEDYTPNYSNNKTDSIRFSLEKISSDIAIIDINTFYLLDVDIDSINSFVKQVSDSNNINLIIDVRDNRGGFPENISKIYSLIADSSFKVTLENKINKKGRFNFYKNSFNFSSMSDAIFKDYINIEGKNGFYITEENMPTTEPNNDVHYKGNVYILINEYSFSAATVFPALAHKYKTATIIGRETGGTYYQLNATNSAIINLEKSGLELYLPLIKSVFDYKENSDIPWGRGVIPDYNIDVSYKEFLNNNDVILDSAITIINNSKLKIEEESKKTYLLYIFSGLLLLVILIVIIKLKQ